MQSTTLRRRLDVIVVLMFLNAVVWGWVLFQANQPEVINIVPPSQGVASSAGKP